MRRTNNEKTRNVHSFFTFLTLGNGKTNNNSDISRHSISIFIKLRDSLHLQVSRLFVFFPIEYTLGKDHFFRWLRVRQSYSFFLCLWISIVHECQNSCFIWPDLGFQVHTSQKLVTWYDLEVFHQLTNRQLSTWARKFNWNSLILNPASEFW